jgi:F-type H+-transporting ATPase subunit delta
MKQTTVSAGISEPYAEALMGLAQDNNLVDQIGQNVAFVLELLNSAEDLRTFLSNPIAKPEAKKAVLSQLLQNNVQGYFFNFVMLLVDRRRVFALEAVCQHYQALLRKLKNTVLAQITSAVELNEGQRNAVSQQVQQMTNAAQVELETKIDPDLIGGVIVKVGSQVLDASIRGQLRRINTTLMSAS